MRGECTDNACRYSHHPRDVQADVLKAGERFSKHEGMQTAEGAAMFVGAMVDTIRAGSLDPERAESLRLMDKGLKNFLQAASRATLSSSTTVTPIQQLTARTDSHPPPQRNDWTERDERGGSRPPTPTRDRAGTSRTAYVNGNSAALAAEGAIKGENPAIERVDGPSPETGGS